VEGLLDRLVSAHRILADAGQGDLVWGHASVRDPDGRGVWMKRAGIGMEEVGRDDLVLVDADGAVMEGDGPRHSEYPLHTEVMAARPDVGAVVHTHPRDVLAFAALGEPLRPVSHEATLFVPPDVPRFSETSDLIRDREQGRRVAATLGQHRAVFLVHHGVLVTGAGVADATVGSLLLAEACRLQLSVMATGRPFGWTADDEALAKRDHCYSPAQLDSAFAYLSRRRRSK
jgi:ribulose-5-phosphate 4-epimerase/fuculose-1-phosphate aldolase